MSAPRLFFYVQHLLGVGHLMRAARLARAAAEAGFEVDLVSGGMPVPRLSSLEPALGGGRLIQLPPARSSDAAFSELLDAEGRPVDEGWRATRQRILGELFAARRPDALMLEMFPFGRRQMRFELLPLLDQALAARPRPLVVSSVRDIVQSRRKPDRAGETAALIERAFDMVLIHGDPRLVRFEESFPLVDRLAGRMLYTGYVVEPPVPRGGPGRPGWGEVVVSVGGGAVGAGLLAAALAARPRSRLADAPWRFLVGYRMTEPELASWRARAAPGIIVERARVDFPALLANCRMSVSQAGYNTVMDIVNGKARAVLVPFVGLGETEQSLRAARLAERGLVQLVAERELTPARLAAAIAAADVMPAPRFETLDCTGAETSARRLRAALEAPRRHAESRA